MFCLELQSHSSSPPRSSSSLCMQPWTSLSKQLYSFPEISMYIVFVPGRVRKSNSTRWQMAWSLRSKKTREVWVGERKDEWGLGQVVYASFLSLRCYYPAVCLFPSILLTKHLEQGKREPLHPIRGVSMETRQTAYAWRNRRYIPPPLYT